MPVLDAFAHYGEHMPVQVIGQTLEGNRALASAFSPSFSILDDSALQVSFCGGHSDRSNIAAPRCQRQGVIALGRLRKRRVADHGI